MIKQEEHLAIVTELAVSKAKSRVLSQFDDSIDDIPYDVLPRHTTEFRSSITFSDQKCTMEGMYPDRFPQRLAVQRNVDVNERCHDTGIDLRRGVDFDFDQSFQDRAAQFEVLLQFPPQGKTRSWFVVNATTVYPAQDHHDVEANRYYTDFSSAAEAVML